MAEILLAGCPQRLGICAWVSLQTFLLDVPWWLHVRSVRADAEIPWKHAPASRLKKGCDEDEGHEPAETARAALHECLPGVKWHFSFGSLMPIHRTSIAPHKQME